MVQKTDFEGSRAKGGGAQEEASSRPTEMTGTLMRKHPQKGEERAQKYFGGKAGSV